MNFKSITNTVVVLLAVVVIIAVIIIPVVQVAQHDQITEANNTTQRYFVSSADNMAVEFGLDDGKTTINGTPVDDIAPTSIAFAYTDKFLLRSLYSGGSHSSWTIYGNYDSEGTSTTIEGVTVTIDDGSATIVKNSNPSVTFTCDVSVIMFPSSTGDYGLFYPNASNPLYVDSDSTLYKVKGSTSSSFVYGGQMTTLDAFFILESGTVTTEGTLEISGEHIEDYGADYYKITTGSGTYESYVAPIKYHIVSEDNDITIAMLGIIPVLLLVVPIMIVVRTFTGRD